MLGSDLVDDLWSRGLEPTAPSRAELDVSDPVSVAKIAATDLAEECAWCVNCAAYTKVDQAETDQDAAAAVNAIGPGYVAEACRMKGMRLLHLSTDFVFDGSARSPIAEDAPANPLGAYGRTKLQGEEAALRANPETVIARTAWLYGPIGPSFPRTIIRSWLAGNEIRAATDQTGSPTYTRDLARVLVDLIQRDAPAGIYHTAGPEAMTRHDLAVAALTAYRDMVLRDERPIEVLLAKAEDFPAPAKRPAYSVLGFRKALELGIAPMRPVKDALGDFCRRIGTDV